MAGLAWAAIVAACLATLVCIAAILWCGRICAEAMQNVQDIALKSIQSGRVYVEHEERKTPWELEQERKDLLARKQEMAVE